MAKGEEPLRSFGDLMQFFKKAAPEPVEAAKVTKTIKPVQDESLDVVPSDAPETIAEASPASRGEEA